MGALCLGVAASSGASGLPTLEVAPDVSISSERFHADAVTDLRAQIQSWLEASFQRGGQRVQLELLGSWSMSDLSWPDVVVRVQRSKRDRAGTMIDLTVCPAQQVGCAASEAGSLRYRVQTLSPVWVLTGPYIKGDTPSCEGLRQTWRVQKQDGAQTSWQGACDSLAVMRIRHPLQPGDVLKATDVMPAGGVIDKQDTLVIARLGGVEIQAKGMALADARVGQQVPVRLNGQAHVVHGVVSAPGVVRVMEGL